MFARLTAFLNAFRAMTQAANALRSGHQPASRDLATLGISAKDFPNLSRL